MSKRLLSARHWCREASSIARSVFGSAEPELKSDHSYVTKADRRIESLLRNRINRDYSDDAIIGEEQADKDPDQVNYSGYTWYIDPIDGTAAFSTNLPVWAVSIGIYADKQPAAGVIMSPFIKEELYGGEGLPPENNNQAVSPDNSGEWDRESLLMVPSDSHRVYSVDFPGKTRCLGSTAYHVGMVVDGRAKGALLGRVHIWDLAGAWAAATESDIRLVDVNGNDPDWSGLLNGNRSETPLLVTNRADCDELVDRINYQ